MGRRGDEEKRRRGDEGKMGMEGLKKRKRRGGRFRLNYIKLKFD